MDNPVNENLKRTVLYYPNIIIPDGPWLRQTLLFWDEIASIVPYRWEERRHVTYPPHINFLMEEEEFRPIRPEMLVRLDRNDRKRDALDNEFMAIVNKSFQTESPHGRRSRFTSHVFQDKVSVRLFHFLEQKGLAKLDKVEQGQFLFEEKAALLYMSLLAKYLSDIDNQVTIPGTDLKVYEKLIFDPLSGTATCECISIRFRDLLPTPRDEVPFSDILEFKRKHRTELLRFREVIDSIEKKLSEVSSDVEAKEILVKFKESIEVALADLDELFKEHRIATVAGSFKSIVNLKSPAMWGIFGIAAGKAASLADLPIKWTLAGAGVLGMIEVAQYLIDKRNERRAKLRAAPLSYLYHAKLEGIV